MRPFGGAPRGARSLPLQAKLQIGRVDDPLEKAADTAADRVMRMPEPTSAASTEISSPHDTLQRKCAACDEDETVQRKASGNGVASIEAPPVVHEVIESSGQPLDAQTRAFMEPRFGHDFRNVRIHNDARATESAGAVGARAYTVGHHLVFAAGRYEPSTNVGRQLIAHELAHVVQQGGAENDTHVQKSANTGIGIGGPILQRWPGDGMLPPGDCDLLTYAALRGTVEATKALVSSLGACSIGDSCIFLATKIAAITAEIAARVALDTTCFKGGDTGHRQQVQDKIMMMNRCYRFFQNSNCPQQLLQAMAAVVERALEVMAALALAAVAVLLVAALIEAILALVAAIAAVAAAAAEAAAALAAAAAIGAALMLILRQISPDTASEA